MEGDDEEPSLLVIVLDADPRCWRDMHGKRREEHPDSECVGEVVFVIMLPRPLHFSVESTQHPRAMGTAHRVLAPEGRSQLL